MSLPTSLAFSFALIFTTSASWAEMQDPGKALDGRIHGYMSGLAVGEVSGQIPVELLSANPALALATLETYHTSSSPQVRHFAYMMTASLAKSTKDLPFRQRVVDHLVRACTMDKSPLVWQHAGKSLLWFAEEDFTEQAQDQLRSAALEETPDPLLLRIAGVARLTDLMDHLATFLGDEGKYDLGAVSGMWYGSASWAARLSRARMGSASDIRRCALLVEDEPDKLIRVTVLLHDLGFVRQVETDRVIARYLLSNERLPPVRGSGLGVPFSQYALDVLANRFGDFPVGKKYVGAYTEKDVQDARQWVRDSLR